MSTDQRVRLHFYTTNDPSHFFGDKGSDLPPDHYENRLIRPLLGKLGIDKISKLSDPLVKIEENRFKYNQISGWQANIFSRNPAFEPIKRNLLFFIGDKPFLEKVKILKKAYIRKDSPKDDSLVQINSAKIILKNAQVYLLNVNDYEKMRFLVNEMVSLIDLNFQEKEEDSDLCDFLSLLEK